LNWPHIFRYFLNAEFRHSRKVGFVAAGFKDNPKVCFFSGVLVLAVHDSVPGRALHHQIIKIKPVAVSGFVLLALVLFNGGCCGLAGVD
jgi:hypothetical protein